MRKPLIDSDGTIVNIVEWDPEISAGYTPPAGLEMLDEHADAAIGGTYDRATRTYSPPPEPEPAEPSELDHKLQLLDDLIAAGVVDQAIKDGTIDPATAERAGIDTSTTKNPGGKSTP